MNLRKFQKRSSIGFISLTYKVTDVILFHNFDSYFHFYRPLFFRKNGSGYKGGKGAARALGHLYTLL